MSKTNRKANLLFLLLVGLAFLLVPLFIKSHYQLGMVVLILVNIAMAVSVRMVLLTGEFHLCHATFMGIGAYVSALLTGEAGLSFWLALPVAAGITALAGLVFGWITLRLKGLYFMVVTFCLGEMFRLVIANGPGVLGGYTGLTTTTIDSIVIPGLLTIDFGSRVPCYYLMYLLAVLVVVVAYRIDVTRYGNIINGIQQNDALLESLGIAVSHYKLLSFVICCAMAGLVGSFWAHYFMLLTPGGFGVWPSIYFLVYGQVGGLGSIAGPIVGAISLTFLHELLRSAAELEPVIFGAILVGSILLLPRGLVSLTQPLQALTDRVFRKVK